jgi:cytochrome c553
VTTTTSAIRPRTLALLLALGLSACLVEPTDPVALGKSLYDSCLPCPGENGDGFPSVLAPSIGGLPQWYIEAQLMKFRATKRGYHFDDLAGLRMRPMALSLRDEEDVKLVAAYIAQMPRPVHAITIQGGDVSKGKALFGTCTACHGADGAGNQALNAPAIAGADDWYLMEQLVKFKTKQRGDPALDPIGATMQAMTATLPDEQAMKDVIAYVMTLPPPVSRAMPAPAAPAPKGEH